MNFKLSLHRNIKLLISQGDERQDELKEQWKIKLWFHIRKCQRLHLKVWKSFLPQLQNQSTVLKFVQRLREMIVLAVRVVVKLAVLLLVIFDVHDLLPVSQILLCHLTACVLPKRALKHPLNKMALQQQFGGRVKGAYQSLNCCLTALQHKTHLMEKMADKPCEILRPRGEHRSTLLWGGDL